MSTLIFSERSLRAFNLTPDQEHRAVMFSPETQAYMETAATEIAHQILAIRFEGSEEERNKRLAEYVYLQGRRDMLVDLMNECQQAFQAAASVTPT